MLIAPTSPNTASYAVRSGEKKAIVRRSNTFNDVSSVFSRKKRALKHQSSCGAVSQLSCIVDDIEPSLHCSQLLVNNSCKKVFNVNNIDSTDHQISNDIFPITMYSDTRQEDQCPGSMAWKTKTSPTSSPVNETTPSSSWIENISSKFSDKTKKKTNGLFGSLRGRSASKKRRDSNAGLEVVFSPGNCPRSPLLVGQQRQRSDTDPSKQKLSVKPQPSLDLQLKPQPSLELQGSTGFQLDHTDSINGYDDPRPLHNQYGSCHELSGEINETSEDRNAAIVRKTKSLPRAILCSPVMSRKVKRPTSQWILRDVIRNNSPVPTSSPSTSALSSHQGSSDTLQADLLIGEDIGSLPLLTPTDKEAGGWKSVSPHCELVPKTSLTRSSSLPFDSDLIVSDYSSQKDVPGKSIGLVRNIGGRLALRSQSFNTRYNTHSVVQRTHSQESMVMREHIVRFLLETEQSYILSLQSLIKGYSDLLGQLGLDDNQSVQQVFQVLPHLVYQHNKFGKLVLERTEDWHQEQEIGDVFVETFSQHQFIDLYNRFIQHYSQARSAIESVKHTKSTVAKLLEERSRENNGKLTLEDLLIKPVQRIPRYLLFVKDLLKHTYCNHPDYVALQHAHEELSRLASQINESERESGRLQLHKELLSTVDGLAEILTETSSLLRCDSITEIKGTAHKKDRLLMIFTDLLVCASTRRRSAGFRKGSLMNVNSIQNDTLKYHIKWSTPLSSLSVTTGQAYLMERRHYNTLEKTLHNLHKDEAIILEMISSCSTLHCPHYDLDNTLQDVLSNVRSTMSKKRHEMENIPHDTARVDLMSHDSSPPNKYCLVFSSQKDRQEWEQVLRNAQLSFPGQQKHNETNKSHKQVLQRNSSLSSQSYVPRFLWHVPLPPCRVGSQLSSVSAPLNSNNQIFVCINDICGRGNIGILNTRSHLKDRRPQLVATLPLSSSRLLCSVCVEHHTKPVHTTVPTDVDDHGSEGSSPSSDSPAEIDDSFFPYSPPTSADPVSKLLPSDTPLDPRSCSAPPTSHLNVQTTSPYILPHPPVNEEKQWTSDLTPPIPEGNQWLWLGSEEGIIYILKVGVSSLHVSSSLSVDIQSSVLCLTADYERVWAGLANGKLAIFNLKQDITRPECYLSISSSSIQALKSKQQYKLVATGNVVISIDTELSHKELLSLSQQISDLVVLNNYILMSLQRSLTIQICSWNNVAMETVMSVDCTTSVMASLKYYDSIITQHKCTHLCITSMTTAGNMILIGTSAGVLISLPLSFSPDKTTPLHVLSRGHVDRVSTLFVLPQGHRQVVITGGHGLEEISNARASDSVPETEGCLLFWYLSKQKNVT